MNYRDYLKKVLEKSREVFDEAEVYLSTNKSTYMETFEGELSKYEIAESGGLSFRGIIDGKMGYSYTEKIDDDSIDGLIKSARDSSKYIDNEDGLIFDGSVDYEIDLVEDWNLDDINIEDKIELVKEIERESLKRDKISKAMGHYQEFTGERYIMNTRGVDLSDTSSFGAAAVSIYAFDDEEVQTGFSTKISRNFSDFKVKEIVDEGVEKAVSKLGAEVIESGEYPVVFHNETFSDILAAFRSVFIAENVQKGFSLLKDKKDELVASPLVTLVDDPFLEDGFGSQSFDDEGMASIFTELIYEGTLKNYLYNWETAKKDGVESTGNASRNYKSNMNTEITNLYIVNGDDTKDEILEDAEGGVYIDSLQGLHSGLNPVSGDFSLSAGGYKIEDGKLGQAIKEITIAGNFFTMLKDIVGVGNDLKFSSSSNGVIGSPTIQVKSLSIAGK